MQCLPVRLWFKSTSPTEEFTYLGLSDLSLLNTEQVLGLIQYQMRSPVIIILQYNPIALKFDRHLCSTDWFFKKAVWAFQHPIIWVRDFGIFFNMTLYQILKQDSGSNILNPNGHMGQICCYSQQKHVLTIHNSYWNFGQVNLPFGRVNFMSRPFKRLLIHTAIAYANDYPGLCYWGSQVGVLQGRPYATNITQ